MQPHIPFGRATRMADLYECCSAVDTISLTAEPWHHFLKINHDIIAELTQPLCVDTVQSSAAPPSVLVMWHLCFGILLICIQGEGRLGSFSLFFYPPLLFTGRPLHLSHLPSPLAVFAPMLMEAQIILPLSLPSPLHPSRPLRLTHQRQCTAYSQPAATMETGVVVYDSERPVCRETDRKGDTQRQGREIRSKIYWPGRCTSDYCTCGWNKICPPLKVRCLVSTTAMLVHWCWSRDTETEVRCNSRAKCMCMCSAHALAVYPQIFPGRVSHSSLRYITHVPLQRAMTDPASGHKFTSPDPLGGEEGEAQKERKKGRNKVAPCSAGEGDGPWLILKTLYYLFKKLWS